MADVSNDLFNKLGKIELSVLSLKPRHQHTVDKKLKEKLRIDSRWQFGIFFNIEGALIVLLVDLWF